MLQCNINEVQEKIMECLRSKIRELEPETVATWAMGLTLVLAVATVAYSLWQAFAKAGVTW